MFLSGWKAKSPNTSNCCSHGFHCILAEHAVTHPFLPAHLTRHCSIMERAPLLDVGHDGVDGFHWHLRRKSMREAGTNQYWRMDFNLNSWLGRMHQVMHAQMNWWMNEIRSLSQLFSRPPCGRWPRVQPVATSGSGDAFVSLATKRYRMLLWQQLVQFPPRPSSSHSSVVGGRECSYTRWRSISGSKYVVGTQPSFIKSPHSLRTCFRHVGRAEHL